MPNLCKLAALGFCLIPVLLPRVSLGASVSQYFPPVETHLIPSKHVKQTFKVQVVQPARQRGDTTSRFPVVYAPDGNSTFDVLKGLSYWVQRSRGEVPPFILVSIGYPGDAPVADALLRARDLTFPGYPKLGLERPPIEGILVAEPGTKDFYGAEDFQRFIELELIPLIDAKYSTSPGERTYFGHSGAGGFGLFTMLNKSHLFKNYIVSSPGLIFHGETQGGTRYDNYEFVQQELRKFLASGKSLQGVKLYMSVGTEEEFEPDLAVWQLTSSFYRVTRFMKTTPLPGLTLTTEALSGETHGTAWPISFMHGLRAVFRP